MESKFVLEMKGIEKSYAENKVLKGVDLAVAPGEILSLVGENGAGKSTLMNILFGMPVIHETGGFTGDILFEGEKVEIHSPFDAMQTGIGMVHQEFMLLPEFTVTENIKLNRELTKPNVVSKIFGKSLETLNTGQMDADARSTLSRLNVDISETVRIERLPVGHMQFVEIARELDKKNIKLIIFDEPTAVLTESEAGELLTSMKWIASQGIAVIFISHKLDEVLQVSDHVLVLRDGGMIRHVAAKDITAYELAELMVGRGVDAQSVAGEREIPEDVIMTLRDFRVKMPSEEVKGIDLDIRRGEIIGLAGLAGHGKIGLANGVMGIYPTAGEVTFQGEVLNCAHAREALGRGIGFVSEDRRNVGLLLEESIEDNIMMASMHIQGGFLKRYGFIHLLDRKAIGRQAERMIGEFGIKCQSASQPVGALSGGNQQKVCVARAVTLEPEMLFVSEPTRGIDIGAKQVLLDYLVELNRSRGMTIVITSSELKELRSVCDRIAVIAEGKLAGILSPSAPDVEFGLLMSGVRPETDRNQAASDDRHGATQKQQRTGQALGVAERNSEERGDRS